MEFLCVLVFALGFITLLGHGIWVLIASIARSLNPTPPRRSPRTAPARCPGCSQPLEDWDQDCPACGFAWDGPRGRFFGEIDGALRQIRALLDAGQLDPDTGQRILDLLQARRRGHLPSPAPAPTLASAPVPPPVAAVRTEPPVPVVARERIAPPLEVAEALPAPVEPVAPVAPPAPPRRTLAEVLSGFMEERNILWGELVGGLLIVGCSIALVLTLWRNLQAVPYFPFLIFTALTASLFGAGKYTLHHWKLAATSRGLLLISLLLVPLNLLVLADPTARGTATNLPWLDLGVALLALAGFTGLVHSAGRDLIGTDLLPGPIDRRWLLALGIVGASGVQLAFTPLVGELISGDPPAAWHVLASLAVGCPFLACAAVLGGLTLYARRQEPLQASQAHALFTFLGLGTFALGAALAFLLTRLEHPAQAIVALATPLVLAGIPPVALGLLLVRRLGDDQPKGLRFAGTGVSLVGVYLMGLGIAAAWPSPAPLLLTLSLAGLTLLAAAFLARVPWVHHASTPALLLAGLVAFHMAVGNLPVPVESASRHLARLLVSASSGVVLAGLSALLTLVAILLERRGQADHATALRYNALLTGIASLLVATDQGPAHPYLATTVHLVCVVTACSASLVWQRRWLAQIGGILLVIGTLWLLGGACPARRDIWGLTLAAEALVLTLGGWWLARGALDVLAAPLERSALLAGGLGLALAWATPGFPTQPAHTLTVGLVALALLTRALRTRGARWFTAFQGVLGAAVLCGVTAFSHAQGWPRDLRLVQIHGIGLGVLALGLLLARKRWPGSLWELFHPGLDRLLLLALVCGLFLGTLFGVYPILLAEWGFVQPDALPGAWTQLHSSQGWLLLGVLTATLLALLFRPEREEEVSVRNGAIVGLALLAWVAPLLLASWHGIDLAGASAARWGLACCFVLGSALLWGRVALARLSRAVGMVPGSATRECNLVFTAAGCVVVVLTAVQTGLGFTGETLPGPLADSPFARLGAIPSSLGPVLLLVVGFVGTALRERWPGYALSAGLLAAASTMGGYALGVVQSGAPLNEVRTTTTLLLGCQVSALASLAWLTARRRIGGGACLAFQAWLGLCGLAILAGMVLPQLFFERPVRFPVVGNTLGALALVLGTAAAGWYAQVEKPRTRVHVLGLALLVLATLVASYAQPWDSGTLWVSHLVLVGFLGVVTVGVVGLGTFLKQPSLADQNLFPGWAVRVWLTGLMTLLALLALRGALELSVFPFVPSTTALASAALAGSVALWYRRGTFAHASGFLGTMAVVLIWVVRDQNDPAIGCLMAVLGLAASAAIWWTIDLPWLQRGTSRLDWPGVMYSPLAVGLALVLLGCVATTGVVLLHWGEEALKLGVSGWSAAGTVGLALAVAVWARQTRLAWPAFYGLGLITFEILLGTLAPRARHLEQGIALSLAGQVFLAGLVVKGWQLLVAVPQGSASNLGLASPVIPDREWSWFLPAQIVLATLATFVALDIAVSPVRLLERLAGPAAVALLVPSAWWMARARPGDSRALAVAVGVLALGILAWAIPDPAGDAPWLTRNGWLFVVLAVCGVAGLEGFRAWPEGRRLAWAVSGSALLLIVCFLGQMLLAFDPVTRRTPLPLVSVLAVGLALAGLLVESLRLALRVERPEPGLSVRARSGLVYLAEALLVVLFLHVRLNVPELFHGVLAKYWSFIVLVLAFTTVGLAEWAERRGLQVLAVPLLRTGVLLPLIPLVAFWARPPHALLAFADLHAPGLRPLLGYLERLPWRFDVHGALWFLTALMYSLLALSRRSLNWAFAAALAVNFGVWALLMRLEIGFMDHPQAWVIPLAMILLVAEYLHRDELTPDLASGLRYLGVTMIYAASTADLFLVGLGNSVTLPILLAALCVVGVLAGILFRVRAFLYLGVGFLLVDVLSMIWHAAVDQAHTWLWWASGIVLGVMILTLFAIFEKRRDEMARLLESMRQWD